MKLSNYEKETIFLMNEADREASVYTYNDALKKQLEALCVSHPEQVRRTEDNGYGGLTFALPTHEQKKMGLTVFLLPLQPLYNVRNAGNLAVSQRFYVIGKRPGRCGIAVFRVKELLR